MFYYDSKKLTASYEFGRQLLQLISAERHPGQPLILLCIGSDRATGDSLGPLVGYKLSRRRLPNIHIYGTLEAPVHAKNLNDIIDSIYNAYQNPYVIALDASLGKTSHIGYFTLASGALKPGAGVGKDLPQVGNLHITGIVNLAGILEYSLLQTTRLQVVMTLADQISSGLFYGLSQLEGQKKTIAGH